MKKTHVRLLALVLSILLLGALLAGCGGKSAAPMTTADSAPSPAESPAAPMENGVKEEMATDAGGALSTAGSGEVGMADPSQKIIYNAYLRLETTDFDDAVAAVEKLVADYKGFVESANVDGSTCYQPDGTTRVVDRTAHYMVRVPAAQYNAARKQAGTIGNVTSSNQSTDNITAQFIDSEARRNALRVQEERLLAMLEKTTDVESLVALETRLSDVRYEMEATESQLRNWQTQVDYSTLELSIQEVEIYTPTAAAQRSFGQKLSDSFRDGIAGFSRGVQNLAIWFVGALPVLAVLAALVLAAVLIVRTALRKRKARRQPTVTEVPQNNPKS